MPKQPNPYTTGAIDTKELRAKLSAMSRQPFMDILESFIQSAPDVNSINEFAKQYPDRWATALKTIANLSGYHDKIEVENNTLIEIINLGDAQLLERLEEVNKQLVDMKEGEDYQELDLVEDQKEKAPEGA